MKLYNSANEFNELIELAIQTFNIPSNAVRKDYLIIKKSEKPATSVMGVSGKSS